jgi:hypothetical protein
MQNKKELTNQYKQTLRPMGVVQVKNNVTGKILIEIAQDLPGKMNSHKFQLKTGRHYCRELQKDYNELGESAFSFEVLDTLKPGEDIKADYTDDLKTLLGMWLEKLSPYGEKGYNKIK